MALALGGFNVFGECCLGQALLLGACPERTHQSAVSGPKGHARVVAVDFEIELLVHVARTQNRLRRTGGD